MKLFLTTALIIVAIKATLIRNKREDGSYLNDSGGPVAAKSEGDTSEDDKDNQVPETEFNLCEKKLLKQNQHSKKRRSADGSLPERFNGGVFPFVGKPLPVKGNSKEISRRKDMQHSTPTPNQKYRELLKDAEEKFKQFKAKHSKSYSASEEPKIFEKFKDNIILLSKMNNKRQSPYDASFSITKHSDMNFDEFKNSHTGVALDKDKIIKLDQALLVERKCPLLNWTSLNVIPPVRKQDKCGICYAMSTVDMIAAQYSIDNKSYKKYNLSAQWIADCAPEPAGYKCSGGRPVKVLQMLANETSSKWQIPTENCYPYIDKNGTCQFKTCSEAPQIKVSWGEMVNIQGALEKEMMAALLQHGPVVAIVGVSEAWQLYNGTGVIRPYQCSKTQNHAVLVTGYDYTGCVPNYIIKNSWGTDWGGQGYIKVEAGKNACGIAQSVVYTCTSAECNHQNSMKHVLANTKHPHCNK